MTFSVWRKNWNFLRCTSCLCGVQLRALLFSLAVALILSQAGDEHCRLPALVVGRGGEEDASPRDEWRGLLECVYDIAGVGDALGVVYISVGSRTFRPPSPSWRTDLIPLVGGEQAWQWVVEALWWPCEGQPYELDHRSLDGWL